MSDQKRKLCTCKHFNGIQHDCCKANINYKELRGHDYQFNLPCLPPMPHRTEHPTALCTLREFPTIAEVEAADKEINEHILKLLSGKSPCCDADIDESQVITQGQFKGHGRRFCSECGKFLYMV